MTQPGSPGAAAPVLPDQEGDAVPDPVSPHLAHLFDYCRALLGQDAEATRTAQCDLDSARPLVHDPARLRARLFEIARRRAVAMRPGGKPSYMPVALIDASNQMTDVGVWQALRALTDSDRELLDLVYRHDIRPADLPTVLGVPAEEAYRRLVNAEGEFIGLATGPEASPGAGLEDIAALPLAALPAADVERQLGQRPARQPERRALWKSVAQRRVQLAAAAVIAAAAIIGTVIYLVSPTR